MPCRCRWLRRTRDRPDLSPARHRRRTQVRRHRTQARQRRPHHAVARQPDDGCPGEPVPIVPVQADETVTLQLCRESEAWKMDVRVAAKQFLATQRIAVTGVCSTPWGHGRGRRRSERCRLSGSLMVLVDVGKSSAMALVADRRGNVVWRSSPSSTSPATPAWPPSRPRRDGHRP